MFKVKNKNYRLIGFSIFFTGIWFPQVGIPLIFLALLFMFKKNTITPSKLFFFQYILIILFVMLYLLFWDDPSIPTNESYFKNKEFLMLIQLLAILTSVTWITLFIDNRKQLLQILYFFSLGMFIKSLWYTVYTIINAPYLLELRQILDPFTLEPVNSPAISLMAVYSTLIAIFNLIRGEKKIINIVFNTIIILAGFFIAVLLQARTFFIIVTLFSIYLILSNLIVNKSIKGLVILIIGVFFIVFFNSYMMGNNKYYLETYNNILFRFEEVGVESSRYLLWDSAVNIILDNPFGGGSTDKKIEATYWFHNLWLDIGRTSGVIPILVMLIFQIRILFILIKNSFFKSTLEWHFLMIFYVSLLIGQFVEIALEGNIVLFVFFVFFHSIILRYQQLGKRIYIC